MRKTHLLWPSQTHETRIMKPQRKTTQVSPAELARRFQRQLGSEKGLDLDEAELLDVVGHYRECAMLDEALKVADRALTKFAFSARLYLAKAKVLTELHVYEYALEVLEQAETYGPGAPQVNIQRAQVYAGLGLQDDAFAELDLIEDTDDPVLKSMRSLAEALIFEQLGRNNDMYFFLEQAIREWHGNDEALRLLWICTELTGKHEQTEMLCEHVLQQDAYNAKAWYNLGHARHAQHKVDEALVALEYAYIINPRYEFAYREAGEICFENKLYDRAIEIYEVMMEYICCDNEVLLRLGQSYLHIESFTQARICINRVLTRTPGHDEALYYSGLCYAAEQKWTPAVNAYRRAIATNDRNELYYAGLAEALVQTGDITRAEHYYQKAADTAPEIPEHWLRYVAFLYETGRALEGISVLDEAEDHTVSIELDYCRVILMIAIGREADALRKLSELLQEDFEAHEIIFRISPSLEDHDLVNSVIRCFA